jgi:predicted  nucleic acid-binding Zn-ribbon protein
MNKSDVIIRCANCNRILSEEERPCPSCGCRERHYFAEARCAIGLSASSKTEVRDSTGFLKLMSWAKHKISRATRRPARESLTIDRTNPEFTRKLHHVEEATETGEYEVVHHEDEEFPAKRRA